MSGPIPQIPSYNPSNPRPGPPDPDDEDGSRAWLFEQILNPKPERTHWRRPGQTRLEAMLDYATGEGRVEGIDVWTRGLELYVQCQGGEVTRDRRRYTIAGKDGASFYVGGHRSATYRTAERRCQQGQALAVTRPDDTQGLDVTWGTDSLRVNGDARYEFHSRTVLMSGTVERTWNKGVVKMCSMEGVICGGAMTRVIAGPSATMSALSTADVYGGIARVSATRSMLALLHYRAAAKATWATVSYARIATFVIEPVVGAMAPLPAYGLLAAKLAKIGAAVAKIAAICPVVDILSGIFIGIPMAILGIGAMIAGIVRGSNIVPPLGPPKTRLCVYLTKNDAQSSVVYL